MTTPCTTCKGTCPTPEACEMPVQYAEEEPIGFKVVWWVAVTFTAVAAVSFIAGYLS